MSSRTKRHPEGKIRRLENGALPLNWIIKCLLTGRHHLMEHSKGISNPVALALPSVSDKVKIG
jgi:hypothetical protein